MIRKLVPDPPLPTTFESQLAQVCDLLRCANATVYECGDNLHGTARDLAMASSHLIVQAQGVVDQLLDRLPLNISENELPPPLQL
ncbi:hypothetical protein RRX38_20510 [Pseudomonas sp. DTU_2021_1001937_2_SI_NGA_ILE_001]|uniref:DUF6124 family protein n=1 Tax=Pseudomonas sp. DTU_2021_1001937_2_SI_NGA_ILE_001 TaxID=3077589 RepID=UPI0028FC2967|nr:hypothetical protein [Pseudomonas sp. DTU_2021_1001937_2_SI_NGA_ILE_001]WNW13437.1 hypothetical protein RRX38_20510 [Pseudomonas sp. DTU_2021_1001937_2_SI_NGA_ILE_001]